MIVVVMLMMTMVVMRMLTMLVRSVVLRHGEGARVRLGRPVPPAVRLPGGVRLVQHHRLQRPVPGSAQGVRLAAEGRAGAPGPAAAAGGPGLQPPLGEGRAGSSSLSGGWGGLRGLML